MRTFSLFIMLILFADYSSSEKRFEELGLEDFENSFSHKGIVFNLVKAGSSSELDLTFKHNGYEDGFYRVAYELEDKKLANNNCDWEYCRGDLGEALRDSFWDKICRNKGLHTAEKYGGAYHLKSNNTVTVDCNLTLSDHILGKNSKSKVVQSVKINDLSIIVKYVPTYATVNCSNKLHYLTFSGPVDQDTTAVFDRLLKQVPRCRWESDNEEIPLFVLMDSGGGFLKDGFSIGDIFRKNNIVAIVPDKKICASSCATAYLGAQNRKMRGTSELLFHAPYKLKQSTGGTIFAHCQRNNSYLSEYYKKMLGDEDGEFLYKRTMHYCSTNSGWSINKGAAKLFGIIK